MKTVKEIYNFFKCKEASLDDFMLTIDGYIIENNKEDLQTCDMSLAQEYYNICEKMCNDLLLLNVASNKTSCIFNKYLGLSLQCSSNPEEAAQDLDYGVYDF